MKKTILILMFTLMYNISFGQNKVDAEKLVNEGIAYHDKGDYDGAIFRYDKALILDKDNFLALTEKAFSYYHPIKTKSVLNVVKKQLKLIQKKKD